MKPLFYYHKVKGYASCRCCLALRLCFISLNDPMLFILIPTNKQISILNLYALNKANKKLPIGQVFQSRGAIPAAGTALGHKLQRLQCSLTAFPQCTHTLTVLAVMTNIHAIHCTVYVCFLSSH